MTNVTVCAGCCPDILVTEQQVWPEGGDSLVQESIHDAGYQDLDHSGPSPGALVAVGGVLRSPASVQGRGS